MQRQEIREANRRRSARGQLRCSLAVRDDGAQHADGPGARPEACAWLRLEDAGGEVNGAAAAPCPAWPARRPWPGSSSVAALMAGEQLGWWSNKLLAGATKHPTFADGGDFLPMRLVLRRANLSGLIRSHRLPHSAEDQPSKP